MCQVVTVKLIKRKSLVLLLGAAWLLVLLLVLKARLKSFESLPLHKRQICD